MHILLTDLLTCPRCGPEFGLILLAERLEERRVEEGRLGCANCREGYPVVRGVADLRHPTIPPIPVRAHVGPDAERAFRMAALLGVAASDAAVLLVEPTGELAPLVRETLTDVHLISAMAEEPPTDAARGIASRLLVGERLPLRDRSMFGVGLAGVKAETILAATARVLLPGGRLVIDPAPSELPRELREHGFDLLLEQDGIVVAAAPGVG